MEVSVKLHTPASLSLGQVPQCPLSRRPAWPLSRFRRFGEKKNLFPLPGFEPQLYPTLTSLLNSFDLLDPQIVCRAIIILLGDGRLIVQIVCKHVKKVFQDKLPVFQAKNSVVCREIFSLCARYV